MKWISFSILLLYYMILYRIEPFFQYLCYVVVNYHNWRIFNVERRPPCRVIREWNIVVIFYFNFYYYKDYCITLYFLIKKKILHNSFFFLSSSSALPPLLLLFIIIFILLLFIIFIIFYFYNIIMEHQLVRRIEVCILVRNLPAFVNIVKKSGQGLFRRYNSIDIFKSLSYIKPYQDTNWF